MKYKPKAFDILLGVAILSLCLSIFSLMFRTKKGLVVVIQTTDTPLTNASKTTLWTYNTLRKGMEERDSFGSAMAKVLNVMKYDTRPDNQTVYLAVNLQTVYNAGQHTYTYKGKNVLVGAPIQLLLNGVSVDGTIVNMANSTEQFPRKKLRIHAELINPESYQSEATIRPYVADAITEGAVIKDSLNRDVLKIVGKDVYPARRLVNTASGEIVLSTDPYLKDVYLTLDVWVYQIGNRYYYFDSIPVLVGYYLPVHLNNISVYPTITDMTEIR